MGSMAFQLPPTVSPEAEVDLERACVAGGQDGMPFPTHVTLEPGLLFAERMVHESGFLTAPWEVDGLGRLMLSSATLMERRDPYDLLLELGRGKIHQLRNQMCEWVSGGLILSDDVQRQIQDATHAFGKAASATKGDSELSQKALSLGHRAAQRMVQSYVDQLFGMPSADETKVLKDAFSAVSLPVSWAEVQPDPASWNWAELDRRVAWAGQNFTVLGGPVVDFSGRGLPDWLWSGELGLHELSDRINSFVDALVRRYQKTIRHWRLSAASNLTGVLATNDEELIWLTVRLVEVVRKIDPQLAVIVGLCQPWGEYLAAKEHTVTPFGFADTLLRTGCRLDSLEIEMVMGVSPRGSYCRDTLDLSRLLDLYVLLGVPLLVTMGYPSAERPPDAKGNGDLRPYGGYWGGGYTAEDQADWVGAFGRLILCKPYVQAVVWSHWDDRAPHQFPYCGLIDNQGQPKPAIERLRQLRVEHLK
jgi:hypothetical protein